MHASAVARPPRPALEQRLQRRRTEAPLEGTGHRPVHLHGGHAVQWTHNRIGDGPGRRPQPCPATGSKRRRQRRGAPRQRPAELHARRPRRHRGEGIARARPRGAADERVRVSAQQARHREPRARRPAQGVGPLRPADRARHPRRRRPDRRDALGRFEFAGELSLGGELRPVHGALAMALALRRARAMPRARWCCRRPAPTSRRWSAACPVRGADHLLDVVRALVAGRRRRRVAGCASRDRSRAAQAPRCPTCATSAARPPPSARSRSPPPGSQACSWSARRAAASRCSRAPRRPAAAADARRGARVGRGAERRRRASAPRAGASACCARRTTPRRRRRWSAAARRRGRARSSLAHHGVLFLDELPEFPRAALEALREPLETGRIVVSRAARQAEFPARFQLVAAMNPCPCGQLGNAGRGRAAARPTPCCATRAGSAGRCSTASTCRSRCRRSPRRNCWPRRRRRAERDRRAPASPRACSARSIARASSTRDAARGAAPRSPLPARPRAARLSQSAAHRDGSAGCGAAAFTASCVRRPHRSPTLDARRRRSRPAHARRGDPVPARAGAIALSRPPGALGTQRPVRQRRRAARSRALATPLAACAAAQSSTGRVRSCRR